MTGPALLRVAIVGAGPAAFYAADALLSQDLVPAQVDMFERLPCPYGLVRFGVAPDHQKIKTVTRAFAKTAEHPNFRFFGNVEVGATLSIDDLREHYHQVLFATGAQSDRKMNIPGEDLRRSRPATDFVAWYNGHPYYRDLTFDLSQETVAIVGVGNVAIDVARILALSPAELARTDMAPHAIEALSNSRVRDIYLLGRRGPAQAAFTNPELKELGELEAADVLVDPAEAELDPVSADELAASGDRSTARKVELIRDYASRKPEGRTRRLHLRFLVSPLELHDDSSGAVGGMTLARNRLVRTASGSIAAEPTGETESIPAGLVFRSVGYRGSPVPGVPFDDRWGVIRNQLGRVVGDSGEHVPGLYTAGWIKRGPSGVIGTNKPDAVETVDAMIHDARCRDLPYLPPAGAIVELIRNRECRPVTFAEWQQLDALEVAAGEPLGRPRVKFTSVQEMLDALEPGNG